MRRGRVSQSRQGKRRGTEAKEPQRSFVRRSRKPPSKGGNVGNKLPTYACFAFPPSSFGRPCGARAPKRKRPAGRFLFGRGCGYLRPPPRMPPTMATITQNTHQKANKTYSAPPAAKIPTGLRPVCAHHATSATTPAMYHHAPFTCSRFLLGFIMASPLEAAIRINIKTTEAINNMAALDAAVKQTLQQLGRGADFDALEKLRQQAADGKLNVEALDAGLHQPLHEVSMAQGAKKSALRGAFCLGFGRRYLPLPPRMPPMMATIAAKTSTKMTTMGSTRPKDDIFCGSTPVIAQPKTKATVARIYSQAHGTYSGFFFRGRYFCLTCILSP